MGKREDEDENMCTLQRVLSWHAERIGRLEEELELQASTRRRLQRSFRSTESL
jgi:hypothetical protein